MNIKRKTTVLSIRLDNIDYESLKQITKNRSQRAGLTIKPGNIAKAFLSERIKKEMIFLLERAKNDKKIK